MNLALLYCACVAIAPLQCWLWHTAHEHAWPVFGGRRGSAAAGVIATCLLIAQALSIGLAARSIALALTLPLAAVAVAGLVYVPCVRAWPRITVAAVWLLAAAGVALAAIAIV